MPNLLAMRVNIMKPTKVGNRTFFSAWNDQENKAQIVYSWGTGHLNLEDWLDGNGDIMWFDTEEDADRYIAGLKGMRSYGK